MFRSTNTAAELASQYCLRSMKYNVEPTLSFGSHSFCIASPMTCKTLSLLLHIHLKPWNHSVRISQNRLSFFTLVPWWPRGRMWYWLRVVMPCGWEDYWCDNSLCQWLSGVSSMPPCLRSKLASHTCTILVSTTDRHRQLPMIYINLGLPVHHRKPPSIASG